MSLDFLSIWIHYIYRIIQGIMKDQKTRQGPKRHESADLVPAQVLHAKVQSCRADTRKTSFWIGAIREAKESSAAEKQ